MRALISVVVAAVLLTVSAGQGKGISCSDVQRFVGLCDCCTGNNQNTACSTIKKIGLCVCCEGDPCAAQPCKNDGICVPEVGAVSCKCAAGFIGEFCETDLCAAEPCKNNGICVPEAGGVSCKCEAGFTGELCENPCDDVECPHGGLCLGGVCYCIEGVFGKDCDDV